MFETHFLFVYLVYILAFVGAVLMLFLSVVLMLPISTLKAPTRFKSLAILSIMLEPVNVFELLLVLVMLLIVIQ